MTRLRQFLAAIDIRDAMFFVMLFAMPAVGGFAGAWLALKLGGNCL